MSGGRGYHPIADYAAIGNLRSVALVGPDGSIDWCCLPELSRPSVFAALLDDRRGGRFRLEPVGRSRTTQRYRGATWVLESRFTADGGEVMLTDFMPLRGSIIGACDPDTRPDIHRLLWCTGGRVEVDVEWCPRFDFARARTRIEPCEHGFLASSGEESMLLAGIGPDEAAITDGPFGPAVEGAIRMDAGDRRTVLTRYAAPDVRHAPDRIDAPPADDAVARLLQETCDTWIRWAGDGEESRTEEWAGEWTELVTRSELVLKLLTHPGTGAIAAAPTTSLPEWIGGVRNWDYRYCWVRDGALVIQALHALGHRDEAHSFLEFVERSVRGRGSDGLQIMYGLHGEPELPEVEIGGFEGYRGSTPVRVGNAAAGQRQHDTYGELLDAAHELVRRGESLGEGQLEFLAGIADAACDSWRRPDSGVWEVRGPERHYVHSKVMVWVALDRAILLAEECGLQGDVERWRSTRDSLHDLVLRKGVDPRRGSFTMSLRTDHLDAAALRFAIEEFVPAGSPRMMSTIDRILDELTENGLVYRYRMDDGLPGGEGAFCVCTFWLIDALTLAGRVDEALELYNALLGRANGVGLLAEQIDPTTGEFLGNFPQAYSHLGVINSALYLATALGRKVPEQAGLMGLRESIAPEHG